ncbi:TorD/DmsD family molecular chaperone [Defluviimonas sp. SAOS-178_SWC]|uniref:TorD/DmsD family molecular chaperone n=1 Tax=Defluviimonas sp. SAOS-178_SWC TaxID=3121287 RepID=UPI003221ACB3
MSETAEKLTIAEEDRLRADLYDFLAALLAAPPDLRLLRKCATLTGDDSALGRGIGTLAKLAQSAVPSSVEREFNDLFIGLGRGELLPYASFYLTGFLNEKPLAQLRRDMAAASIARADNVFEPEDNIASLMEMMAGLIEGRFGPPAPLARQREFFNRHIAPWAGHFFADLEGAKGSVFYAPVGAIGRAFMAIEKEAFRLGGG